MSFSESVIRQCDTKESETKMDLHILWRMLKLMKAGFWRYLFAIIGMSVVLSGFDIVTAMLLKSIIARVSAGSTESMFVGLPQEVIACLLGGILMLGIYVVGYYVYTMESKIGGANMQKLTYSKCLRLPYSYYENTHSGEFMSKAIYDSDRAQGIYGSRFRRVLMPLLMTCFYLIPMFMLSWQVTLCLFGASVALFVVNGLFIGPMQRVSKEMSKTNVSVTERITTILSGMEQIKMFGLKRMMVERFIEDNEAFRKGQKKMNVMSATLDSLNQFFELLGSLVFIALGLFFVGKGITTVDNLAAIYVLYGSMSWNLLQVGLYIPSMASYLANAKRVFEFLELAEEPEGHCYETAPNNLINFEDNKIVMKDIDFSYDGRLELLQNFNLAIPKGKCIAIKGESGKGKSTVAKLLLGLYPVKSGQIYLDGRSYDKYLLHEIRDKIGYVPQEPYLYDVSIAENIRYGRPDADMDGIVKAAKLANAHEFIMQLEHGYETRAGERGNLLSGGQKQRIAIARAILKDAPVLILDEATSALDNKSEQLVNEALERLMQGRTTIVIAHRESTLERADKIIEM